MPFDGYLEIIEIGGWETRSLFCAPAARPPLAAAMAAAPLSARLVVLAAATSGAQLLLVANGKYASALKLAGTSIGAAHRRTRVMRRRNERL